ncbi:ABC transporter [Lihuaxuella thermophila]|uniref:ABC transporter n=2 Tax=Lihuaxuella thermophila TaxID=1173111 RepID=A0A1H8BHY1_9BACL|nr:ABC transporter [Lihuaxuella thermophila]
MNPAARNQMRREVQVIFQHPSSSLNPCWPVSKIITEPLKNRSQEALPPFLREVSHSEKAMAGRLLEMVGLHPSLIDRVPRQLSGGQQQRVAIARAVSVQPALIICDEPTASLDLSVQSQILQLLKHLQEQCQISYLFISHRLETVYWISDRILTFHEGRLADSFPCGELWDADRHAATLQLIESCR